MPEDLIAYQHNLNNMINEMPTSLLLNFRSPDRMYILTVEDDGKVAYAYLKRGDKIVGDVWLYNRGPTPEKPEWTSRDKLPFANSKEYVRGGSMTRPVGETDVLVNWHSDSRGAVAYVYIFEDLYGVVGDGDKPGYARFAIKDGPLAKVMEIDYSR